MKRKYNEKVLNVERESFTPAVFVTTEGMSPGCKRLINRLAELYAIKKKIINSKRWSDIYASKLDLLCYNHALLHFVGLGAKLAMISLLQMFILASFQIIQMQNNFVLH